MPASTLDYAVEAQEKTLSALRESQAAVLDVVETWAKAVEAGTKDIPAIPVAAALPSVEDLVKNSYDFAGKLLAAQSDFALKVVAAASPAVKTTPVKAASK